MVCHVPLTGSYLQGQGLCTLPLRKRQIYLSLVKLWISLSGVEENLMKYKKTGIQHVTGVLCTLAVLLFYLSL